MALGLVIGKQAIGQLARIQAYVADHASPEIADRFVGAILDRCEGLTAFPNRGTPRDDLRPGLRTVPLRSRVTIGYVVDHDTVVILGINYGGQDAGALFDD